MTSITAGVPCWVDTLQADPAAARGFYARVFGWEISRRRRLRGRAVARPDVAGIGALPGGAPAAAWFTHVRVEDVDARPGG